MRHETGRCFVLDSFWTLEGFFLFVLFFYFDFFIRGCPGEGQ